jgi:hypothetical protein
VIVKNLNGVTTNKCTSETWLDHWEKLSGQKAYMCFAKGCINTPSVGGHVQKDSPTDKDWYVIPLCGECNKKRGEKLDIWDTATLVLADAIGIAAVTSRSFAQWASERFPERRLFSRARLRNN